MKYGPGHGKPPPPIVQKERGAVSPGTGVSGKSQDAAKGNGARLGRAQFQ